jgi:serine/threonine-protein kinase
VLYVVSEFVPGPSLRTLISASVIRKARLSEAFTLYVGAEVASALHHAHTRTDERGQPLGIIHRDVSPGRIYLRPNGAIALTDFALARSQLPGRVKTTVPHAQGDTFYASPEALLLEPLDARADLFSLGLVLLELATWHVLYEPPSARASELEEQLTPHAKEKVHAAGLVAEEEEMPGHVDDCILRAATYGAGDVEELTRPLSLPLRSILRTLLQRRPEDRYPSAAVLEDHLRAVLAAHGVPYGAAEALAEARHAVACACQHIHEATPAGDGYLPGVAGLSTGAALGKSGGA